MLLKMSFELTPTLFDLLVVYGALLEKSAGPILLPNVDNHTSPMLCRLQKCGTYAPSHIRSDMFLAVVFCWAPFE